MTRDDIIRMAREAGKEDGTTPLERSIVLYAAKSSFFLEKFAALVAAAEREQIADMLRDDGWLYCATMVELRKK
jgi:hypothetical protein